MFGSCWTCGGNHFSRECPKGDGGGGGTKGGGKNNGKAIKCFNCGGRAPSGVVSDVSAGDRGHAAAALP